MKNKKRALSPEEEEEKFKELWGDQLPKDPPPPPPDQDLPLAPWIEYYKEWENELLF